MESVDTIAKRAYSRLSRTRVLKDTPFRTAVAHRLRKMFGIPKLQVPSELLISDERKFVYVGIPKVASTSIEHALRTSLGSAIRGQFVWLQDLLKENPETAGYFKFAFVRNPWARVVSVYKDKLSGRDPDFSPESFHDLWTGMAFEAFVEWLCSAPEGVDENADRHWLSQHRFVAPDGELLVDYLGRYESLADEWPRVTERAKLPHIVLPAKNTTREPESREAPSYRRYYDSRTRRMVGERYSRDIELFGYRF